MSVPQFVPPWGWLQTLMGLQWPKGDEDAMRRCGAAWLEAADSLLTAGGYGDDVRAKVNSSVASMSGDAFNKAWDGFVQPNGILDELAHQCASMTNYADATALQIESTKISMNIVAALMYWEFLEAMAEIAATFGLDTPLVAVQLAAEEFATREALIMLAKSLLKALEFTVLPDLIAETVEMFQGNRGWGDYDWSTLGHDLEHGIVMGAFFALPGIGGGLARKFDISLMPGFLADSPFLSNGFTKAAGSFAFAGASNVAANALTWYIDAGIQKYGGVQGWAEPGGPFSGWQNAFANGLFMHGFDAAAEKISDTFGAPRLGIDTTGGDSLLLRNRTGGAVDPNGADGLYVFKNSPDGNSKPEYIGTGSYDGTTGSLTVTDRNGKSTLYQSQQTHILDQRGQPTRSVEYPAGGGEPTSQVVHGGADTPLPQNISVQVGPNGPERGAVRGVGTPESEPAVDPNGNVVAPNSAHVFDLTGANEPPKVVVAGDGIVIPVGFDRPLQTTEAAVYGYEGQLQEVHSYPGGDTTGIPADQVPQAGQQAVYNADGSFRGIQPLDQVMRPEPVTQASPEVVAAIHERAANGVGGAAASAESGAQASATVADSPPAVPGDITGDGTFQGQNDLEQYQRQYAEEHQQPVTPPDRVGYFDDQLNGAGTRGEEHTLTQLDAQRELVGAAAGQSALAAAVSSARDILTGRGSRGDGGIGGGAGSDGRGGAGRDGGRGGAEDPGLRPPADENSGPVPEDHRAWFASQLGEPAHTEINSTRVENSTYVPDGRAEHLADLSPAEVEHAVRTVLADDLGSRVRNVEVGGEKADGYKWGDQPRPPEQHDGANTITAAHVPGARATGHGVESSPAHTEALRLRIEESVKDVVDGHGGYDARQTGVGTYEVTDKSDPSQSFTIRVETQWLDGHEAARSILNHDKGKHVIQVSDNLHLANVKRALAHEFGEIVADRGRYGRNEAAYLPDAGTLKPGPLPADARLLPHDAGRIQELRVLGEELAKLPPDGSRTPAEQVKYNHLHQESLAIVEHLGLREGTQGAAERRALIDTRLTDGGREQVGRTLVDAGAPESDLPARDQALLRQIRLRAEDHQQRLEAFHAALAPNFDRPVATDHVPPHQASEMSGAAYEARQAKSRETLAQLRAEKALLGSGEYPKRELQIGGGASLAGRDSGVLLVDARGRWQADNGDRIAQTADQLRNLRQTGLGDPYQFVDRPGDRVPLDAVNYMQDTIAAAGPNIDGRVESLRIENGKLLADIQPADWSGPVTVEVVGTPVITTGFPAEQLPGLPPRYNMPRAFGEVSKALAGLGTPEAEAARQAIQELSWRTPASAAPVLEAARRGGLEPGKAPDAFAALETAKGWEAMREANHGRVLTGDEANLRTAEPDVAEHWVVAGPGGTSISAVENLLKLSPEARFTIVGGEPPAGLGDNTQWREVRQAHDLGYDPDHPGAASTADPINPGATGRLSMVFGVRIKDVVSAAGADGRTEFTIRDSRNAATATGDGVIASLGGRNAPPPMLGDLIDTAERAAPGSVSGRMLFDEGGQYLGYRVTVGGFDIDVSGAASRFFPITEVFTPGDHVIAPHPTAAPGSDVVWSTRDSRFALGGRAPRDDWDRADPTDIRNWATPDGSRRDAPGEGGNFDGGYVATATQATRYAAFRRKHLTPRPMPDPKATP